MPGIRVSLIPVDCSVIAWNIVGTCSNFIPCSIRTGWPNLGQSWDKDGTCSNFVPTLFQLHDTSKLGLDVLCLSLDDRGPPGADALSLKPLSDTLRHGHQASSRAGKLQVNSVTHNSWDLGMPPHSCTSRCFQITRDMRPPKGNRPGNFFFWIQRCPF